MIDQNEPEIAAIADAIDAILTAITMQPSRSPEEFDFKPRSLDQLLAESEIETQARQIVADPVGASLRIGIVALAERLNELGGLAAMARVLDDVVARDVPNEEWRTDILDKRFDGIGAWGA